LISVIFVAGAGTAYAGIVLPTITLGGNVVVTGDTTLQGDLDMSNNEISNVATPVNPSDAATKAYVDSGFASLSSPLTGLLSVSAGSTTVTGAGTLFLIELAVGDAIKIGSEIFTVSGISSNTFLELDSSHITGSAGVTGHTDPWKETGVIGSWRPSSSTSPTNVGFVIWDIEEIFTDTSAFTRIAGNERIQINQAGTYLVTASVLTGDLSLGETSVWDLEQNGNTICRSLFTSAGDWYHSTCTVVIEVDAGDYIQLKDFDSSTSIFGNSGHHTILSIHKIR